MKSAGGPKVPIVTRNISRWVSRVRDQASAVTGLSSARLPARASARQIVDTIQSPAKPGLSRLEADEEILGCRICTDQL